MNLFEFVFFLHEKYSKYLFKWVHYGHINDIIHNTFGFLKILSTQQTHFVPSFIANNRFNFDTPFTTFLCKTSQWRKYYTTFTGGHWYMNARVQQFCHSFEFRSSG